MQEEGLGGSRRRSINRLEALRRKGKHFRDLSFPTTSGAGSNGAIVHYWAMPETEKCLGPGTLYLLDSGAQYLDGTTDVMRTIAIGEPSAETRATVHPSVERAYRSRPGALAEGYDRYTNRRLCAPRAAAGRASTTTTARARVGSYLGVHEGPQRISKAANTQALLPGMNRLELARLQQYRRLRHPH